ncbi:Hydantoinase/dihydropyrimidinase [Carpediemonas membranifera]|uniref:dihydropyrimidinase n=1 Tax=Carpediemonas membranifera TaxID=201153 RepID=A0A8J6BBF5_9EUKA|nr:Hydantoinase/dihydropyrimidinase [Carpediemonas membranifera]|eukprot:KAG9393867.1 Hydantoinase/dihydropyrimidinase [Carpediemonas membranifera]
MGFTIIKNGTVVNSDNEFKADVLIEDGKIAQVAETIAVPEGATVIDATGKFVMPGGIDTHVHLDMNIGVFSTIDDYTSGSRAALLGGTTSYIDFINPDREIGTFVDAYNDWRARADAQTVTDYGLHCSVPWFDEQTAKDMETLVNELGVCSFKHFLAYKGRLQLSDEDIIASFQHCKRLGALPQVHAENGDIIVAMQKDFLARGLTGPASHPTRPAHVESEACERACTIAAAAGVPLVVAHNTNKFSIDAIERSRKRGNRVFTEVCGIHLALDESRYFDPDRTWLDVAHHVLSPPLRAREHVDALWGHIVNNNVDLVGSDHCSWSTAQRQRGRDDFTLIPNGCAGIQERTLIMWEEGVMAGRLTRTGFVNLVSANPCRLYNLYGKKGVIAVGADADISIWNPARDYTLSAQTHGSKIDYSVFEGKVIHGCPETVMVRGTVMVDDCKLTEAAVPGFGQYMPRKPFAPAVYGTLEFADRKREDMEKRLVRN